jgi:outer membrane protein assembly factor BamB
MNTAPLRTAGIAILLLTLPANAGDWPMAGRSASRNAVSPEKGAPVRWAVKEEGRSNVKWEADLGHSNVASPVVSGGLVWVGTNNAKPRDPKNKGDAAVLMCFREADGKFLWQYVSPRLPNRHQDIPRRGINCSPLVEGNRLYFTTNRCEVVCFNIRPLLEGKGEPQLIWKLDMIKDLGVQPGGPFCDACNRFSCSIGASYQGRLYVTTGNGVAEDLRTIPAPNAPSLVCLDRDTGRVLWKDNSPGKNILQVQWGSPLLIEDRTGAQVVVGQGDGWIRSFDALSGGLQWKFDTNPKSAIWEIGQQGPRGSRNHIPATPVFHGGRVYIANGRAECDHIGVGHLWCIDAGRRPREKDRDLSPVNDNFDPKAGVNRNSGLVWHHGGMEAGGREFRDWVFARTLSNVAIHDGLVIAPDLDGYVDCLDARTGKKYWTHDARGQITVSPLIVDGKLYICTEDGEVQVLALAREKKVLAVNDCEDSIFSAPVFANGVLFVTTSSKLYAIRAGDKR